MMTRSGRSRLRRLGRQAWSAALAQPVKVAGATLLSLLSLTVLVVVPIAQEPPARFSSGGVRNVVAGDPLPGLTPLEFELFRIGLDDFLEVEDAEEGLGPAFNGTSCGGCHNVPAVGGISPVAELRAGMVDANGNYSDFDPDAGSLFQLFSTPPTAVRW